ncbi:SGNH/GDSL hydrolase family protein [Micromonospora sp. NPDC050276]|uniref:SGNH/GDSL hydrolase family protein n=1 Tax=Micromonospora sp. NPDC050276 TaxID=3364278 RepID=UPI003794E3C8
MLGAGGAVGFLTFVRAPVNPPAEACADEHTSDSRPVVVAAGASMTQGTLGADWVGALRARPELHGYEFVNAGVNGSTSADLRQRVDTDILACHPNAVTILVGTNDVRDGVSLNQYRDNLNAIVDLIKSRATARIALMSLPPLGEDLDTAINRKLTAYNTAIKEAAARAQADYLPVYEQMVEFLQQRGSDPAPYDFSFALAFGAATQHYLFGHSWDDVARNGGRELLVDHIHLNDRGGAIITDLAAQWLSETQLRPSGSFAPSGG